MNILTNDPSLTAWGWAVVELETDLIVATGCARTSPSAKKLRIRKGDDRVRRISEIANELNVALHEYKVKYIVSELPHGSQSYNGAIMVGLVLGLLVGLGEGNGIPVEWYSEADAKKSLGLHSPVSKASVVKAIDSKYMIPWSGVKYQDEAIADAMAVYHCATKNSMFFKYFKK